MPLKIVRNDITKMNTEAIVNTASSQAAVGTGCDYAVYTAAGYDELLKYRTEKIGDVPEGEAFITPGFKLQAKYIIHAVSPLYMGGDMSEEEKLRSCYRNSLALAKENHIKSIAFPLISTGSFGYPKEEGMRIAVDEINAFLLGNNMEITLVVFDTRATLLGEKIYPDLQAYIDYNYIKEKREQEYGDAYFGSVRPTDSDYDAYLSNAEALDRRHRRNREEDGPDSLRESLAVPVVSARSAQKEAIPQKPSLFTSIFKKSEKSNEAPSPQNYALPSPQNQALPSPQNQALPSPPQMSVFAAEDRECSEEFDYEEHEKKIEERMRHLTDTYSEYLMYLIQSKNMKNADVWKRGIVDKKIFSKIKNDPHYHPQKITALCLCMGAKLNLDESKDLLARAGYALSPCDKTDIIFSYFIENEIYDMVELDIQLEEYGLPCIIT